MLYLLSRDGKEVGWDESDAMVIRASSESEARQIANSECSDEGRVWTDETLVTCDELDSADGSGLILDSFNAG